MGIEPRSRNARASLRALLSLIALSSVACGGKLDGPASPGGVEDPSGDGDGDGSVDTGSGLVNGRLPARVWRLTTPQLHAELRALFGEGVPGIDLLEGAAEHHLTNVAANAGVDIGNVDNLINGTRAVANWVVANGESASRCGDSFGTDACVETLLGWLPEQAYRRPVTDAERSELRALFDSLSAEFEHSVAFAGLVRSVLMSPDFLYRTELGPQSEDAEERVTMTGHEIATLLAYAIADRGPDEALLAAAAADELSDPEVREAQVRRLVKSSGPMWQRFFWEWLHMETFRSQAIEVQLQTPIADQMEEEYAAFLEDVIVAQSGNLGDVFSAPYTFARPELAAHYGAPHPGGGLARVELDPEQRGGLLTLGAWLVAHGKAGRDNVVRRGMNVYREAMCNDIRPPDGVDVNAELAKLVGPDATVLEAVEARGSTGSCAGCHNVADPVGLAFENYTSDGRWQTTYPDGRPVESMIELHDVGSFDRASELSAALTQAEEFRSCFMQRFTQFMLGRDVGEPSKVTWLNEATTLVGKEDDNLTELLVELVRTPAFIERAK
jgi:hypothetical protein